jgi:predicted TIM-barrel fold metal-dependent hydrolase
VTRIDAHTHIFAPSQIAGRSKICERDATFAEIYGDPKAAMATAPELLAAIDEAGIDRAVVAGFAFANERDLVDQNDYLLASAAEARGRIIPLATVNPGHAGWELFAVEAVAAGARGFGELRPHNQGWDPLGPAGQALCELAKAHDAVLLWHVSEPVGHIYPGKGGGISPVELCELATTYRGVKMVAAHLGGGLSFYFQMPEVKEAIDSLYFDTAASSLLYDDGSIARLVDLAGAERVLYGSDYPLLSPRRQLQRLTALLPGDVAEAVCGGSADTLFSDRHDS